MSTPDPRGFHKNQYFIGIHAYAIYGNDKFLPGTVLRMIKKLGTESFNGGKFRANVTDLYIRTYVDVCPMGGKLIIFILLLLL